MKQPLVKRLPGICLHVTQIVSGITLLIGISLAIRYGTDFFVTADQRGQYLLNQQAYQEAAATFVDPMRRGAALYRNGDFKHAASVFAGVPGEEAAFNRGNALVMQGKYSEAVESYDRALQRRPDWLQAKTNREIALGRAKRMDFEGGDMTGGKMGADEIVFDLKKDSSDAGTETMDAQQEPSDEALREMWLRQVQTTPGDFLKAKFAFQQAMRQSSDGGQDE